MPSSCKFHEQEFEKEDQAWEVEFYSKDRKTEYEVQVDAVTGKVRKYEMEKRFDKGGISVRISKKKAKKTVQKKFKRCTLTGVKKKKDDGRYVYRVLFQGKGFTGKAEFNTCTGKLIAWTLIYA